MYFSLQAEVIFLGQLKHPHLVNLIGYCCEDEHRLLVYEFMPRGSLEKHIFKGEPLFFIFFLIKSFVLAQLVSLFIEF